MGLISNLEWRGVWLAILVGLGRDLEDGRDGQDRFLELDVGEELQTRRPDGAQIQGPSLPRAHARGY